MPLKPWYREVEPRDDLKSGKPLDASEFAVHLDHVRDGRAPEDYQKPERFFERTFLTDELRNFASEVVRRLSGETTQTSAVFNMSTQFGGGKTHALTLLYHLVRAGKEGNGWTGVRSILEGAGVKSLPKAEVGVFVGLEFDSLRGRGGDDGTPKRRTPWGELAWQIGREKAFGYVAKHDEEFVEPKGDAIRDFLPKDRPCLILMDEILNYVSTYRQKGYHNRLYNFIQALSETVRGHPNTVLVVSIPASELEYTPDDEVDQQRFKKMLDRLGKAVEMAGEKDTSEIIRRRLFDWHGLPDEGRKAAEAFARWVQDHKEEIPNWFPTDHARESFEACYPIHPNVLSVFQRKWQVLPRFQRTRGVLRLLALWVTYAYKQQCDGKNRDAVIGLGTAPLEDTAFRLAALEQLGNMGLEPAILTDICGKKGSHAVRLDETAVDAVKKARMHRKVATAVFFESNGGQEKGEATVPEIRLAVAEPDLETGHLDSVLEGLGESCYYMTVERNRYRFSTRENLNKRFADRRANIQPRNIEERVRAEIQKVFTAGSGVERVFFPEKSSQIPDRPALTLVVLPPDIEEKRVLPFVESMTRECGNSSRTFKNALVWCAPEASSPLTEEARKTLAWEDIQEESGQLNFDEIQRKQLSDNVKKALRDLREAVWRTYKNLYLLGKDNKIKLEDLGLVTSSQNESMARLVLSELQKKGDVEEGISANTLVRNWPAFKEWSTKAVRDAVFASPLFPRLLSGESIKDTIAKGVSNGVLAYVGKVGNEYRPFVYGASMLPNDVEISDDVYVIKKDDADAYKKALAKGDLPLKPESSSGQGTAPSPSGEGRPGSGLFGATDPAGKVKRAVWSGDVPAQKWTNFYMKVLSKFAAGKGLKITVTAEMAPPDGVSAQKLSELKSALRELGLDEAIREEA